jgi:hypothetical protein
LTSLVTMTSLTAMGNGRRGGRGVGRRRFEHRRGRRRPGRAGR